MREILETMTKLRYSVDKIQGEIFDIVNSIDRLSNGVAEEVTIADKSIQEHRSPNYRNPQDIPDFDRIDTIETAQIHATDQNDSVVSVDILVPDIPPDGSKMAPL